ncbi:hypothetical protein CARG_08675 [Corynebacterium argentoratense DSM 44202]|uniref:Uncharacterized protein n=1 Tax=Corynebacterium argentoratense DSM 44202 TaxID=1348662 RepID=U3GWY7_9CORY|nr:hypothetical protein CARG_08675 [Corynebacterium argentoratense DSM 44202]
MIARGISVVVAAQVSTATADCGAMTLPNAMPVAAISETILRRVFLGECPKVLCIVFLT